MRGLVYRLEDRNGNGPYCEDNPASSLLTEHQIPQYWFKQAGLPEHYVLMFREAGFVFGWKNKKAYDAFFKPAGQIKCAWLGFGCKAYKPYLPLYLPDGQVMFLRENDFANNRYSLFAINFIPLLQSIINSETSK